MESFPTVIITFWGVQDFLIYLGKYFWSLLNSPYLTFQLLFGKRIVNKRVLPFLGRQPPAPAFGPRPRPHLFFYGPRPKLLFRNPHISKLLSHGPEWSKLLFHGPVGRKHFCISVSQSFKPFNWRKIKYVINHTFFWFLILCVLLYPY